MKIIFLSLLLNISAYNNNDHFVNTNWVSKVASRYTESLNLRENNYVIHYNTTSDHTYHGCYSISKDTLIIKERDNSKGKKVCYRRIKFLRKDNVLYPCCNEELINHQWAKSKAQIQKSYIFKKV